MSDRIAPPTAVERLRAHTESSSSAQLMLDRRFWPLFWVQFLTAFNDNVFKTGLVLLVTFGTVLFGHDVTVLGLGAGPLNALGGLALMVPFLLFSATAGQLADKLPKASIMRRVKTVEIVLMVLAAAGFVAAGLGRPGEAGAFLLVVLFFMGAQSAVFGPVKYSIIPQILPHPGDLVAANALVETGTYLSVLMGTATATALFVLPRQLGLDPSLGLYFLAGGLVFFALLGRFTARFQIEVPAEQPDLKVQWEPITTTWRVARVALSRREMVFAVLANSWFWALGATVLTLLPTWVETGLGASETVYTFFLVLFSVGIGAGSLLCARFSRGRVEMGLVIVGAIGMTVFLLDLWLGGAPWTPAAEATPLSLAQVLARPAAWRLTIDLLGLAMSGGFFMVPLYSYLQEHGAPGERARIIGALNIINAVFIVGALGVAMGLLGAGITEPLLFLVLAIVNALWVVLTYLAMPERALRMLAQILSHTFWRFQVVGRSNLPEHGGALLVCNHVSYVDWLLIMGAIHRKHRFVIWHSFTQVPVGNVLTRQCEVIPITDDPSDRRTLIRAFKDVAAALEKGHLVVIFPEGGLPYHEGIQPFMRGIELMLKRSPVPVVPMVLNGLWGSPYSRKGGGAFKSWRGPWRRVWLTIDTPLSPEGQTSETLREHIIALWKRRPEHP